MTPNGAAPPMSTAEAPSHSPRFSIVSAVYNVERYLDEFIMSVESQTFPLDQVEVIVVNDGSTDSSPDIVEAWQQRRPDLVKVVTKPNGGLSSARNAGLPHVRGEWVTFTDPDDVLDKRFLAEVDAFLRRRPETVMVATNRIVFSDTTGKQSKHPLHGHFVAGVNRLRNLDYDTGHFHGHAASTFFRSDVVEQEQLTFDERLRATFEDGHFCNVYLLRVAEPLVAYLPDARYYYRRRDDGTSQLDRSWASPGRFTDVIEHGYLALLREGVQRRGRAPSWLQGMVIYELQWYFKTNEKMTAPTAAYGETAVRFHQLFEQVCELLDETGIQTYRATSFNTVWREVLQHGCKKESWHTPFGIIDSLDSHEGLMRLCYRFTGDLPDEVFSVYGKEVSPVHKKIRDIRFFDRTVLHERIVWLPFGTARAQINDEDLDLRTSEPGPPTHRLDGVTIQKRFAPKAGGGARKRSAKRQLVGRAAQLARNPSMARDSLLNRAAVRLARTAPVRYIFRDSWVLIDRIFNADDSAEHLFRYLRAHRRKVNAWFVVQGNTPDYQRLRNEGYRRVISHGSFAWKLLMLNCQQLVSSHADDVVVRPAEIRKLTRPQWRFVFLQHGVIKDDLSTWLNRKNIDLFVTSTQAEFESIVADHTTYRYTTREARLTGLPRFDRILEEGNRCPADKRDLILIAPTWRQWLSSADQFNGGRHSVSDEFRTSEFATKWTALLNSAELRELAERTGLTVALLMHPNFQETGQLDTQSHVVPLHFEGQNIQELFARSRVLVTDYSSMFFNAAYIERPVVYFQFDRDRMNAGWHLGRHGYFDYERDGYGPVTLTVDDAADAVVKAVENGPEPETMYLERIRESFPDRDGRCCERVADAIIESTRPVVGGAPQRSIARRLVRSARRIAPGVVDDVVRRVKAA